MIPKFIRLAGFVYSIVLVSSFSFLGTHAFAQFKTRVGGWNTYVTHRNMQQTVFQGNTFYALSSVGFTRYNIATGEYQEYTRREGLSGTEPTAIGYDPEHDLVFIGYKNGLIDFFRDPREIRTIRDIYLSKTVFNKEIFHITGSENDKYVYFSTGFGILLYDVEKRETRYTYTKIANNDANSPILRHTFFKNRLYVLLKDVGIFSAPLNAPNLADASVWQKESGKAGLPNLASTVLSSDSKYLYTNVKDVTYYYDPEIDLWKSITITDPDFFNLREIKAGKNGNIDGIYIIGQYQIQFSDLENTNRFKIYDLAEPTSLNFSPNGEYYVITDKDLGFILYKKDGTLFDYFRYFTVGNNRCQDIAVGNNQLYIAPFGYSNNYAPSYDVSGLFYYDRLSDKWKTLTIFNGGLHPTRANRGYGAVDFNTQNGKAYVSAYDQGIATFKDGVLQDIYDAENTCFTGIITDTTGKAQYIRVLRTRFEHDKGITWMIANGGSRPITAITNDNRCFTYPSPVGKSVIKLEIDDNGYKWVGYRDEGIYVFTEGETLGNSIAKGKMLRDGAGRGNLPSNNITALRKDLNGSMWVGTNAGIAVFYNTYAVLNSETQFDAVCPIFNGRCLLKEDRVTAIAVDGANRKWVGTQSSGVFLFNPDGTEELLHFNTENSPLFSDNILAIEIEPLTGEVFIATLNGLMGYQGSATAGLAEGADLYVFPNPVHSDYDGQITIRGSVSNAIVRITTVSGALVRELRSDGGQTVWDGKNAEGKKVATGIYLAFVSDDDGKNAGVAKIAFIER